MLKQAPTKKQVNISFLLFIGGLVVLIFFLNKLLYLLHGYSLDVIDSYTAESFAALKKTAPYKRPIYILVLCMGLVSIYLSNLFLKHTKSTWITVVYYLSVFMSFLLGFVIVIASITPSGMVG